MRIKEKFELMYKGNDPIYNIVPISRSTLQAYELSKEDSKYLLGLVKTFGRIKNHPASKLVEEFSQRCLILKFPLYPLPGFVTDKGIPAINLSVIPVSLISDYSPNDIFSLFLYSIALKGYFTKKPFSMGSENNIANMFFSIFMKMFGKKSGLTGSVKNLIPRLRFLILLYVTCSFMGEPQTELLINKLANSLFLNKDEVKIDYDFTSTIQFLTSIKENDIIPISENKFSMEIISRAGMSSLPMFEDISRFYATILASTVPGNVVFSSFWSKVHTDLFQKLYYTGLSQLHRSF